MDHASVSQALEPFLALAKSATSPRAAADLITQATSAPNTFLFAELLAQKNIEKLKNDAQYGSYHTLLEVFAWGTWEVYQATKSLPALSDTQALKLRLLSLMSYASETNGSLDYFVLCGRLDFDATIDLEHLVTTAIYSNLLVATLNPAEQIVLITSVAPFRDLKPGSIRHMLDSLEIWAKRCDSVLEDLESEIAKVKELASITAGERSLTDDQFNAALEASDRKPSAGSFTNNARASRGTNKREATIETVAEDDDLMEVDNQQTGARKKSGGLLDKLKPKS